MSFKTQVEDIVGSVGDDDALSQWLTDSAVAIINVAPQSKQYQFANSDYFTSTVIGSETEVIGSGKVLSVYANGVVCRFINSALKYRAADSDDMEYATATDPVFYVSNGKINALPASIACRYDEITYPSPLYGDSEITNFPGDAEQLVVLATAIKARIRQLADKRSDITLPLAISANTPVAPATPSFTYSDASSSGVNSSTVSFSATAPTFTQPVVAPDWADADDWVTEEDSEMVASRMQIIGGQLNEYQTDIQNQLQKFNKENAEYQAELQVSITNARNAQQEYITEAQLSTDVDKQNKLQSLAKEVQEYSAELQKHSTEIQSYSAQVSAEVQEFANTVQGVNADHKMMLGELQELRNEYKQGLEAFMRG